jgi:hypothetical protein
MPGNFAITRKSGGHPDGLLLLKVPDGPLRQHPEETPVRRLSRPPGTLLRRCASAQHAKLKGADKMRIKIYLQSFNSGFALGAVVYTLASLPWLKLVFIRWKLFIGLEWTDYRLYLP